MPVRVIKQGPKFRVVEGPQGKIAKNKGGSAVDGGGHITKEKAIKQSQAINLSQRRKQGKSAPPSLKKRK